MAAIRWLPLVNQSSFTIPAFACLRVVSTALDATGQLIYTVDQPNGDASANYLFNGPFTVAAGPAARARSTFPARRFGTSPRQARANRGDRRVDSGRLPKEACQAFPCWALSIAARAEC